MNDLDAAMQLVLFKVMSDGDLEDRDIPVRENVLS